MTAGWFELKLGLKQLHGILFDTFYFLHRHVLENSLVNLHPHLLAQLSKLTQLNVGPNKLGHL